MWLIFFLLYWIFYFSDWQLFLSNSSLKRITPPFFLLRSKQGKPTIQRRERNTFRQHLTAQLVAAFCRRLFVGVFFCRHLLSPVFVGDLCGHSLSSFICRRFCWRFFCRCFFYVQFVGTILQRNLFPAALAPHNGLAQPLLDMQGLVHVTCSAKLCACPFHAAKTEKSRMLSLRFEL